MFSPPDLGFGLVSFHINRAVNLEDKDMISLSDPFVTIEVDGKEMFKTKVIEDKLNPVWDEYGSFQIAKEPTNVEFLVKDKDHIGSNCLGKVLIPFKDIEECQFNDAMKDERDRNMELIEYALKGSPEGKLMVATQKILTPKLF